MTLQPSGALRISVQTQDPAKLRSSPYMDMDQEECWGSTFCTIHGPGAGVRGLCTLHSSPYMDLEQECGISALCTPHHTWTWSRSAGSLHSAHITIHGPGAGVRGLCTRKLAVNTALCEPQQTVHPSTSPTTAPRVRPVQGSVLRKPLIERILPGVLI